jgi:phytoene/squalene synthetase
MNTIQTYRDAALKCSQAITCHYSTSFSWAIRLLHEDLQPHIHAIYGFVRLADEIVDTFHEYDKRTLLAALCEDTQAAIRNGISLNPVLQSFQYTVNRYQIDQALINAFLYSMELDLDKKEYHTQSELDEYIYGSAEVVGLMCLKVFCDGDEKTYRKLTPAAKKLGAALQKINFLRDLDADIHDLQRSYFPAMGTGRFDAPTKQLIEDDITADMKAAFDGVRALPVNARLGVYIAYRYYLSLFNRIKHHKPAFIKAHRVRVPDFYKLMIILDAGLRSRMNLI